MDQHYGSVRKREIFGNLTLKYLKRNNIRGLNIKYINITRPRLVEQSVPILNYLKHQ